MGPEMRRAMEWAQGARPGRGRPPRPGGSSGRGRRRVASTSRWRRARGMERIAGLAAAQARRGRRPPGTRSRRSAPCAAPRAAPSRTSARYTAPETRGASRPEAYSSRLLEASEPSALEHVEVVADEAGHPDERGVGDGLPRRWPRRAGRTRSPRPPSWRPPPAPGPGPPTPCAAGRPRSRRTTTCSTATGTKASRVKATKRRSANRALDARRAWRRTRASGRPQGGCARTISTSEQPSAEQGEGGRRPRPGPRRSGPGRGAGR